MNQPPENPDYAREWCRLLRSQRSVGEFERGLFAWYVTESEAMLERIQAEAVGHIQDQVAAGYEEVDQAGLMATEYQARRVRYSHIIYLVSMLETFLKRECHRLALALGDQGAPFSPGEIKGDQWTSKKKFLERFGHFEIPEALWSPVRDLTTVRNNLVHDNGAADAPTPALTSIMRVSAGIKESSGELDIESEFVTHASASIDRLIDYIHDQVSAVIDRRLRPQYRE